MRSSVPLFRGPGGAGEVGPGEGCGSGAVSALGRRWGGGGQREKLKVFWSWCAREVSTLVCLSGACMMVHGYVSVREGRACPPGREEVGLERISHSAGFYPAQPDGCCGLCCLCCVEGHSLNGALI